METKLIEAKYVSVWDRGDHTFRTKCFFNPETKEVTDIESADVDGIELFYVEEEYIELPNGEQIRNFTLDGTEYVDGQRED